MSTHVKREPKFSKARLPFYAYNYGRMEEKEMLGEDWFGREFSLYGRRVRLVGCTVQIMPGTMEEGIGFFVLEDKITGRLSCGYVGDVMPVLEGD